MADIAHRGTLLGNSEKGSSLGQGEMKGSPPEVRGGGGGGGGGGGVGGGGVEVGDAVGGVAGV